MTKNARQTALDVLNDIFGNDAYANISLDRNLRDSELSTVDKAFVTALVYGVVSKKDLLEWHITPFLKKNQNLGQKCSYCLQFIKSYLWIRSQLRQQ